MRVATDAHGRISQYLRNTITWSAIDFAMPGFGYDTDTSSLLQGSLFYKYSVAIIKIEGFDSVKNSIARIKKIDKKILT